MNGSGQGAQSSLVTSFSLYRHCSGHELSWFIPHFARRYVSSHRTCPGLDPRFLLCEKVLQGERREPRGVAAASWTTPTPDHRKPAWDQGPWCSMAHVRRMEQAIRCVFLSSCARVSDVQSSTPACTPGDLLYIEILGQKILVINSEKIAQDLLDKRSQTYSDRPQVPMVTL